MLVCPPFLSTLWLTKALQSKAHRMSRYSTRSSKCRLEGEPAAAAVAVFSYAPPGSRRLLEPRNSTQLQPVVWLTDQAEPGSGSVGRNMYFTICSITED